MGRKCGAFTVGDLRRLDEIDLSFAAYDSLASTTIYKAGQICRNPHTNYLPPILERDLTG